MDRNRGMPKSLSPCEYLVMPYFRLLRAKPCCSSIFTGDTTEPFAARWKQLNVRIDSNSIAEASAMGIRASVKGV
jgi:hypothetical protein